MKTLPKNKFKAALAAGDVQIGVWSSLCSPIAAEIMGSAGFDWVLFDAEHSPVEISGLMPLLQAVAQGPTTPIVRPPWNDSVLLKRVLDIGAQTVLVPFVETEAEAEAAAAACRFPPAGIRGVAAATRASSYGQVSDYLKQANSEICTLVQIETGAALARIDAIAATEGVDGVFIGPADLSASLGHIGELEHPQVVEAIRSAPPAIRAAGKAPGILAASPDAARRYLDFGYQFVACQSDVRILSVGLAELCDTLKTGTGDAAG